MKHERCFALVSHSIKTSKNINLRSHLMWLDVSSTLEGLSPISVLSLSCSIESCSLDCQCAKASGCEGGWFDSLEGKKASVNHVGVRGIKSNEVLRDRPAHCLSSCGLLASLRILLSTEQSFVAGRLQHTLQSVEVSSCLCDCQGPPSKMSPLNISHMVQCSGGPNI